ncbi:MAG TPA: hypothetical protein VL688_10865 [Verrucomicrobiae bacterium]|nr:hypothetical protein [Verrucomicrobiae bacterium]
MSLFLPLFAKSLPALYAYQIKAVHHVVLRMDVDDLEITAPLDQEVDPRKTFLMTSQEWTTDIDPFSNVANCLPVEVYFPDSKTVRAVRSMAGSAQILHVLAVEFESGATVYRGVATFDAKTYKKNIKLPFIRRDQAFPLVQARPLDPSQDSKGYGFFKAAFQDEYTLSIERSQPAKNRDVVNEDTGETGLLNEAMPPMRVSWQAVEIEGSRVQSGIASMAHFAADTNAYLLSRIEDLSKAFLVLGYTAGEGAAADSLSAARGVISEPDQVSFYRGSVGSESGQQVDFSWYVVELPNPGDNVQQGSVHFEDFENEKIVPLADVHPELALAMVTASVAPGDSGETDTLSRGEGRFAAEIQDSGKLRITRGLNFHASAADVNWQVVDFAPLSFEEPAEGAVWTVGEKNTVRWKHARTLLRGGSGEDGVHLVNLSLSLDGGADGYRHKIASGLPASADQYPWTLPEEIGGKNPIGLQLKFRLEDKNESVRNTAFSGTFAAKGLLDLTAPDGGETWYAGEQDYKITWKFQGKIGNVALYYDKSGVAGEGAFPEDNKLAVVPAGSGGLGFYLWRPDPRMNAREMRIQIRQEGEGGASDISKNSFSVIPRVEIIDPVWGNETWQAGTDQMIRWKTTAILDKVNLSYAKAGTEDWVPLAKEIPAPTPGEGAFRWKVPDETAGQDIRFKIAKADDPTIFDTSPDVGKEAVAVLPWVRFAEEPPAGRLWHVGETLKFSWASGGKTEVFRLAYLRPGNTAWEDIAYVKAGGHAFEWQIPDLIGSGLQIRIEDVNAPAVSDVLKTPLEIAASLHLKSPAGGENWIRGQAPPEITWDCGGSVGNVSLYYLLAQADGSEQEERIAKEVPCTTGKWNWTLPDKTSKSVRIKIQQEADERVYDISKPLAIRPGLTFSEPHAETQIFYGGRPAEIAWRSSGTVPVYGLSYALQGIPGWIPADEHIGGGPEGEYHYSWTVPGSLLGKRVILKIEDVKQPEVSVSTAETGIPVESWIELLPMDTARAYRPGESVMLRWSAAQDVSFIRLQYSADQGQGWTDLAVLQREAGSYEWHLPSPGDQALQVRIADLKRPEMQAVSGILRTVKEEKA